MLSSMRRLALNTPTQPSGEMSARTQQQGVGAKVGTKKALDPMQLFERRCVVCSDHIIRNSTKSSEWKVLAVGGVYVCEECIRRFGLDQNDL
jgi:hypothetical protein